MNANISGYSEPIFRFLNTRLTRGAGPALAAFSERCAISLPPQSLRTLSWAWYAQHRQLVWVQIGLFYYIAVLLQRHARVDAVKVWTPESEKIVASLVLSSLRTSPTLGKPV